MLYCNAKQHASFLAAFLALFGCLLDPTPRGGDLLLLGRTLRLCPP